MASRLGAPLAVALAIVGGCHADRSAATAKPCSDGSCRWDTTDCELGSCMTPKLAFVGRSHSPQAAVFRETASQCPSRSGPLPDRAALTNVSDIPEFRRGRARATNMNALDAAPADVDLHAQLVSMQGQIFDCIDLAACYDHIDPYVAGTLEFDFDLEPSGQVSSVSVRPSPSLEHPVVQACARRSLFEHRFSAWNGARMQISYRVDIGESL